MAVSFYDKGESGGRLGHLNTIVFFHINNKKKKVELKRKKNGVEEIALKIFLKL